MDDAVLASLRQHFRATAAQFMKGLRAARRWERARRLHEVAVALDASPEMRAAVGE